MHHGMNFLSCETQIQNELQRVKTKQWNPQPAAVIHDQFFLTKSPIRQVSTTLLLTEEALFIWVFGRRVPLFKYSQEFKVAYQ